MHTSPSPYTLSLLTSLSLATLACGAPPPAAGPAKTQAPPTSTSIGSQAVIAPEPATNSTPCHESAFITTPFGRYCLHMEPLSWRDAQVQCQLQHQSHLAALTTVEENRALRRVLGSQLNVTQALFFGLVEPTEGHWEWLDGSTVDEQRWAPGEPNNVRNGEHCAEWRPMGGLWNDIPCDIPHGFVCENDPSRPLADFICEGKRVMADDGKRTLCIHTEQKMPFGAAQLHCEQSGGRLAGPLVSSSAMQDAAAFRIAAGSVWLGLTDQLQEDHFQWVSGEAVSEEHWNKNEPNNLGDEDCVEWLTHNGQWNDKACHAQRPFLCQLNEG